MKRADEIFAVFCINRGFSADGRINHRKKRRRNQQKINSALINRRRKSRQIADDTAAERDYRIGARKFVFA